MSTIKNRNSHRSSLRRIWIVFLSFSLFLTATPLTHVNHVFTLRCHFMCCSTESIACPHVRPFLFYQVHTSQHTRQHNENSVFTTRTQNGPNDVFSNSRAWPGALFGSIKQTQNYQLGFNVTTIFITGLVFYNVKFHL